VDYVDGAIEPILTAGQTTTIEGFGFGATQGTGSVTFAAAAGGVVPGVIPDSASWTDLELRVVVPAGATGGTLTVLTAAGLTLTSTVHVFPRVPFDPTTLTWQARTAFPQAPVGVGLASAEFPSGSSITTSFYAAGGAEPIGGDSSLLADSGVYVAQGQSGGAIGSWARQHDTSDVNSNHTLPAPRAFAAAAVATRYNSRLDGAELIVVGGIDSAGNAQASVLAAPVSGGAVTGPFTTIEPLPAPVAGAIAVVRRGRIYVMGGADSAGRPQSSVFVGRVGLDGRIDGWFTMPSLSSPRAFGGGVVLDDRAVAFGGIGDSADIGGGLDATPSRLVTSDTAPLSPLSGFFLGSWGAGAPLLPQGRSQFATLNLGTAVLAVGGVCDGGVACPAETVAASLGPDSLGVFTGPFGNTIVGLGGGTVAGAAGVTWRDGTGAYHGLVLGGMDLTTRQRVTGVWGF
jgi:hypothetical protein